MKKFLYIVVWLVALVVITSALLLYEGHLLWKLQEMNLFLSTSMFLKEQMVVPGGLLTWAGMFFTQFFYWPWLGVLLLAAWWWLLMWIVKRAFRIPDLWAGLLLIPVAVLLMPFVTQGYWIYVLKLQGHCFMATIGTTAVAALLWLYRLLPSKYYLRTAFVFLTCALGYPLMGIYGLAAPLLMAVWSWRLREHSLADTVVALLSAVAVPLFCYRFIFYQTNLANIYYAGLPLFYVTDEYHAYYVPYYLLALFFVVLALVPLKSTAKPLKPVIVQAVVLAAVAFGVFHFWFKDENFHRELAMQHHVEQLDWEGVLQEAARQQDEPTRAIVMMKNLALGRLGRQGSEMYLYKNGSKPYNAPYGMRTMLAVGPLVYYQYGILNYSVRLSTEMGVEFGWRAEHLKTLAKCAILNGEKAPARKYLGLLQHTLFFKDWADQNRSLIGDTAAIARHPEYGPVRLMMHYDNDLNADEGNVESFLMNQLASSTYAGNPLFTEQTLLASLWTRNAKQFWYHFYDYVNQHPDDGIPIYYQEAAYLFGYLEERPDLDSFPVSSGVKESFQHFMESASRYNDADIEVARRGLYPFFGQTYFYEYYVMNHLPEY